MRLKAAPVSTGFRGANLFTTLILTVTPEKIISAFAVLECDPRSSHETIKASYRELVKVWHPDRFLHDERLRARATEKLKIINEAYELLGLYYAGHTESEDRAGHGPRRAASHSGPDYHSSPEQSSSGFTRVDFSGDCGLPLNAKSAFQLEAEQKLLNNFSLELTPDFVALFASQAAEWGMELRIDEEWPAAGSVFLPVGLHPMLVVFNPLKATVITLCGLCIGIGYLHLLRNSPYAADRALVVQYEEHIRASRIIEKLNTERRRNPSIELLTVAQYIAEQQAFEYFLRDKRIAKEGEYKKWFRDWTAQMRITFEKASEADLRRNIDYKWHNDGGIKRYFRLKI